MQPTLGSHPGAILFRMTVMVILIAILVVVFFSYLDGNSRALEHSSVAQTQRVINSTLTVVFTTYAVNRQMAALADVDGANPFEFMRQYDMVLPPAYRGEVAATSLSGLPPGWHYLAPAQISCYKARYGSGDRCFRVTLGFDDINGSGAYEPGEDSFRNLGFPEVEPPA